MTPIQQAIAILEEDALTNRIERALEVLRGVPQSPAEPTREQLLSVMEAAYGLCHGYDWNCGTAAIAAGYRRKLLSAVNAIKEVPDFEGKYRDYGPDTRPDRNTGEK